jgi:protein TonB
VSNAAWIGEETMFRETLLESSPMVRRNKRWPMATAFTVELIIAAVLIIVPLLSTGVIPILARTPPIYTPINRVTIPESAPARSTSSSDPVFGSSRPTVVMLASNNLNQIYLGPPRERTDGPTVPPTLEPIGNSNNILNSVIDRSGPNVRPVSGRIKVSVLSEARLVNKVEPIYPRIAVLTNVRGEVKLHAIIARDGSIQSLNVTSGHPLLATAALEAVRQWKYQPYILNGDAVEVETFITVNFKRAGD